MHPRVFQNICASLTLTALFSAGVGLITVWLGTTVFKDYGIALFCGTPIAMGAAAPFLYGLGGRRSFLGMWAVSLLAQFALFVGMLLFALEGLFCVVLATPLWMIVSLAGTCIAYPVHVRMWRSSDPRPGGFPVLPLVLFAMVPAWMGAEHIRGLEVDQRMVSTSIEIDADPETVWKTTLAFTDLPAPPWSDGGWLFHLGIARPIRAEFNRDTNTRCCVFSTGRAQEPVRTSIPNQLLEVDIISTPPAMHETSIYPNIHPAHLEGYLVSKRARFELTRLANGGTRLTGTSWYVNRMAPQIYWGWWSDQSINAVQVQVLAHIKSLAESDRRAAPLTDH